MTTTKTLRGSCLCGGVRYEINGPLFGPCNCHCSMCRKQHGAAFRSRARVQVADFKWVQGEDLVRFYESSPGSHRGFCSVCGSPVANRIETNSVSGGFNPAGASEMIGIQLGALDDDPGVAPESHVFVVGKAPWFTITDDLPQFDTIPGGASAEDSPPVIVCG
jgi:hypothetical protein